MLTIIGNALNSTNKKVLDKMNKMDFEYIKKETQAQLKEGAEYIELSAISLLDNEMPFLEQAIPIVEAVGGKVLVRSDSIEILKNCATLAKKDIIIGDVEFDREKITQLLDLIIYKNVKLVALIKDKNEKEETSPEKSLLIAQMYIDYLLDCGVKRSEILLNPIVRPLEENCSNGRMFLNTLELFKLDFPQIRTIANLYMLSEGLPRRNLICSYFVALAIEKGLDFGVINILERSIAEALRTTHAIIGKDRNMQFYLNFCRHEKEYKRNQLL
jgi:5-methyltetrahydrofolate--homocysteine methyltransferase